MAEKPILFSGPMVRAILDGRKTMTRRVLKPQPPAGHSFLGIYGPHMTAVFTRNPSGIGDEAACIPYAPGDLLWVRENCHRKPHVWTYAADGVEVPWPQRESLAGRRLDYCPSIHLPRKASRISLRVIAVKVERLQDITKEDVIAEGITEREGMPLAGVVAGWHEPFVELWNTINGHGGWEANPWVAAYSFERVKP
jgi:hypothetical protein